MQSRFYVIAYDIVDDPVRRQAAKLLLAHGERVQDSVYECELSPTAMQNLRQKLEALCNPEQDGLRVYMLCGQCREHIQIQGGVPVATLPDFWLV